MSKILGIIAAVCLIATAFVAFKNKAAYQDIISTVEKQKKQEISRDAEIQEQKEILASAKSDIELSKIEQKKAEEELAKISEKHEDATRQVADLEAQYERNEAKLQNAEEMINSLPDPDEVIPKVTGLRVELSELKNKIASSESTLANLSQTDAGASAKAAEIRNLIALQSSGKSFPNMRTSISAVYRSLGFVTLSAGDKQGVVNGSSLDVVRGSEIIAKLKVTAVEAGRSAASIELGSVAEGVTIHAGDTVIPSQEVSTNIAATPAQ